MTLTLDELERRHESYLERERIRVFGQPVVDKYDMPETVADSAPIEPCGLKSHRMMDGTHVTTEEYFSSDEWLAIMRSVMHDR